MLKLLPIPVENKAVSFRFLASKKQTAGSVVGCQYTDFAKRCEVG
jgi:hypothetical protein